MPVVYIDKKPYEVKPGKNLLEASLALGFDLPYFCWHPALGSVGACRQCAVKVYRDENDNQGRLVMSCMEEVKDGLHFSIDDVFAKKFREQVIEWLMTNHPHDCPVCDEGGSCHLQDMTLMTGHDYRRYEYKKRTYRNQYLGPLIHHEMNRCIQCYRCVRYYRDYAGGDDLNVFAAHNHVYFGREKDGVLESPFSGNLVEVCPTGVFTDKTLKAHYTRKWDLTMAPSVCQHCSVGCNTIAGERYGQLRTILNRYNGEVNGYFLCDRGRFGYEFVNSENRIQQPLIRNRVSEAVTEPELTQHLQQLIMPGKTIGIGSPRASMESNFALQQLVGQGNFYQGITEDESYLTRQCIHALESGRVHPVSLKEIEEADAILILGEDIWNTAPMIALAVRTSVKRTAAVEGAQQLALPAWQDAAIREFIQDSNGWLANITVASSPLDEFAAGSLRAAPDDIARLGFAVAAELNESLVQLNEVDESLTSKAKVIAEALTKAKKPVIISGISSYNDSIVKAAFDIAVELGMADKKAGLAYVMPECNSMGLAMMHAPSFDSALHRVGRESAVNVIVLENDLYRNIPAPDVETFFAKCDQVVVLDSMHNRTTAHADVLIPSSTFAEGDGTIVNYEGRAQRFFQVFMPSNSNIKESWKWLGNMAWGNSQNGKGEALHPDLLLEKLSAVFPAFEGITEVAPSEQYRVHGERIPREPHRYSGRTAITAHIHVSEGRPMQDGDSPLSYSMEGYKGMPPSSAIPFFWAPGWNSVQSVTKYQEEPGGPLAGGDPGVRLFKERTGSAPVLYKDMPERFRARERKWLLLPQYHVLGSGELSSYTKALQDLSPEPFIGISGSDAATLNVIPGDIITVAADKKEFTLPVKTVEGLPHGVAVMSAGLMGSMRMNWGSWVQMEIKNASSLKPSI
jgi:NADH-quinone oxidoreductase subunit G